MQIANGLRLASNPGRLLGSATAHAIDRPQFGKSGSLRNFYCGAGTVIAGASIADTAALPNGAEPPHAWHAAPKGGGLSAYNTLRGGGAVTITSLSLGRACEADLTGAGAVANASLSLIASLLAGLVGSGTVAAASISGSLQMAAALAGSGQATASLQLLAFCVGQLTGAGTASGTLRGTARMEAGIVVTGDLLNTSNVAAAVWEAIAEGPLSYAKAIRIILASAGGDIEDTGSGHRVVKAAGGSDVRIEADVTPTERSNTVLTP